MPDIVGGEQVLVVSARADLGVRKSAYVTAVTQRFVGQTATPAGVWHTLKISLAGPVISGFVDGKQVATATDGTYQYGRAGLATGWNRVQFDDLAVE